MPNEGVVSCTRKDNTNSWSYTWLKNHIKLTTMQRGMKTDLGKVEMNMCVYKVRIYAFIYELIADGLAFTSRLFPLPH